MASDAAGAHSFEDVARDPLHGGMRTRWLRIRVRPLVAGRFTQAVAPPNRRRVEDEVSLWAGIHRGSVSAVIRFARRRKRWPGRDHFEARNVCRVAVPFPADDAR